MSRLLISARELTTLGIDLLRETPAAPKDTRWMHDAAQTAGPRATRRHNLAVACSMVGSQTEIARRLAEATGARLESCRTAPAGQGGLSVCSLAPHTVCLPLFAVFWYGIETATVRRKASRKAASARFTMPS